MKTKTKYDVNYFINKFETIPDYEWCEGQCTKVLNNNIQHCALGHCGVTKNMEGNDLTDESKALIKLFGGNPNKPCYEGGADAVISVNDGGPGSKQRILNKLKSLKTN